jgi:hypothetical protein
MASLGTRMTEVHYDLTKHEGLTSREADEVIAMMLLISALRDARFGKYRK